MDITIYHHARCSNARGALALIREAGFEPHIIDYLSDPPDVDTLSRLIKDAGLTPRQAMRSKEACYAELGLADPTVSDASLIAAMVAHPELINRPFVVTPKGTRLCRPPELVRALL